MPPRPEYVYSFVAANKIGAITDEHTGGVKLEFGSAEALTTIARRGVPFETQCGTAFQAVNRRPYHSRARCPCHSFNWLVRGNSNCQ